LKKNILIIGGNSDIAQSLSALSLRKKFRVFLFVRKKIGLLNLTGDYEIIENDISNFKKTRRSILFLKKKYKVLHYLIINSAKTDSINTPFDIKKIKNLFELNFFSNIYVTFYILKVFRSTINKVIHVSSNSAIYGSDLLPAYSASKAALDNMINSLNKKYKNKVKFYYIRFGPVFTTKLKKIKSLKWIKKFKNIIISPETAAKKIINIF
jgi:short-subunit dehydrogenase